jgi:hypothetical protein
MITKPCTPKKGAKVFVIMAGAGAGAGAWCLLLGGVSAFAICLDFGGMRYIV